MPKKDAGSTSGLLFGFLAVACAVGVLAWSVARALDSGSMAVDTAEKKDDFVYDSKGKKDPFLPSQPLWTPARTATRLRESKLDGLIWDENSPMVILEGKALKVGDTYLGARVEKIEKDQAIFLVGEEKITVLVAPPIQEDKKDEK